MIILMFVFYLTVLATRDYIKVEQKMPYGDILISRGPEMWDKEAARVETDTIYIEIYRSWGLSIFYEINSLVLLIYISPLKL